MKDTLELKKDSTTVCLCVALLVDRNTVLISSISQRLQTFIS
jgi:hypothetical protein